MLRVMAYFASSKNASRAGFLDGPPVERLIDPIAEYCRERGQRYRKGLRASASCCSQGGRCIGARCTDGRTYYADNVIIATPVHNAAQLLPAEMLRDPLVPASANCTSSPVINGHFWFDRPVSKHTNLIFGAGTLLPVHADLGQASAGYEWPGKSFIEVCIAPADELIKLDDDSDDRSGDARYASALSACDQASHW